jgi:ribonucleotide reductase beta subunit family protein with ferritin-like domain
MIDTYIQDPAEKTEMFAHLAGVKSVQLKVKWASDWAAADAPFGQRLVAFAIVEGLYFSGAFCAIYWIKQRGLLPGLTKSNEFIARDEGQHTDFACLLYSKLPPDQRVSPDTIRAMFADAVAVEKEFILESIPCKMVGMNSDLMSQYIEYVADGILGKLLPGQGGKMFGTANPFSFMDLIGMEGRSNFFEERVSLYQRDLRADTGKAIWSEDF